MFTEISRICFFAARIGIAAALIFAEAIFLTGGFLGLVYFNSLPQNHNPAVVGACFWLAAAAWGLIAIIIPNNKFFKEVWSYFQKEERLNFYDHLPVAVSSMIAAIALEPILVMALTSGWVETAKFFFLPATFQIWGWTYLFFIWLAIAFACRWVIENPAKRHAHMALCPTLNSADHLPRSTGNSPPILNNSYRINIIRQKARFSLPCLFSLPALYKIGNFLYTENMHPPKIDFQKKSDLNQNQSYHPHRSGNSRRKNRGRVWFWLCLGLILLGLVFLISVSFAFKFYTTSKKVIDMNQDTTFLQSIKAVTSADHKPLRGEERGRINILLVGLAGKNYPGSNLTDSIMIASINPKTWQTALLSIPRDFFVPIPETKLSTKINALYARGEDRDSSGKSGIDDLKSVLAETTGQPIDYYIACDFDGFRQIIDELDGIKVQVPKDLHDERYPGPNYSYETFEIKAGLQDLDGETALKYARTRHDEDGDFGRAFRQQQILEAARSKAYSLKIILNIPKMSEMLDTLGEHLRTNVQLDELNSFLNVVEKIDTHTTVNKVLDAGKPNSLMAVSHVYLGGVRAFILVPRTGDYSEIQDISKNIFSLDVIEKKERQIKQENASVSVINASGVKGFDAKLVVLLKKIGYEAKLARAIQVKPMSLSADSARSIIYDLAGTKPFSLEDLSKKFNAKIASGDSASAMEAEPPSQCQDVDFCLVAGSDIADKLNYEENSVEDLENGYDQQQIDEKGYIDLLKRGSNLNLVSRI